MVKEKSSHPVSEASTPQKPSPAKKLFAGLMVHWQIIASASLLTAGVVGLANTYESYCGQTDLTYAPSSVRGDLTNAAQEANFRPGVLAAQLETESHWRNHVSSHAGARGLAQFTDDTWEIWGEGGDITNPHDSIAAQGRYLAYLQERLKPFIHSEDDRLAITLAGYNAGPGAVEEFGGVPPYFETENYIVKINELAASKYQVTCNPDPAFKQARITEQ